MNAPLPSEKRLRLGPLGSDGLAMALTVEGYSHDFEAEQARVREPNKHSVKPVA